MSFQCPQSTCSAYIRGLGDLKGYQFPNGVQQYCGIPYAVLAKRWTRSLLKTSWADGFHDGTKLGDTIPTKFILRNDCPRPESSGENDSDELVPVPPAPHFPGKPTVDELSGLVMNIVLPAAAATSAKKFPVMVYVHGGSLLYGGANLPIFDAVNLVSQSEKMGLPIVCVNFNYRVGLGGFLACLAIQRELEQEGFAGCGNFGFTDQQVAFEWVQRYISDLGGDPARVTAVGESAGGISISHQMCAARPPVFHRAVCMSGLSMAIPAWRIEQHEKLFEATCRHFDIDPAEASVLELLRNIPQQELANATPLIQGVISGTGNACIDGWFYARNPQEINNPPSWVEAFMLGDTYHEGVIFHLNIADDSYDFIRQTLLEYLNDERTVDRILSAYNIEPDIAQDVLVQRVEHMYGDAIFKIPNYAAAMAISRDRPDLHYFYHFDQRSMIPNSFEGTAYHAYELLYLFRNLENEFSPDEITMARDFAASWIRFINGEIPWKTDFKCRQWKVWGPNSQQKVLNETEDENVRLYSRMARILEMGNGQVWKKWLNGVDALVNKRMRMGRRTTA
ncbi:Alpha/Beta hydrolase protein [Talaromyces proteolyticus]|uniref:Alpha/Beta hydrolase protein n=1 Tax=Talaromyces proteolyticus TaxID=1131652 RepID=A0AAD4KT55_9EURO|nr:Alpha/Beta hydrolase protein [Talaromyces proteolyticus]KAH8698738.1 Alpha/Beta hydrolase protein [Talaromyces proteolyticus]